MQSVRDDSISRVSNDRERERERERGKRKRQRRMGVKVQGEWPRTSHMRACQGVVVGVFLDSTIIMAISCSVMHPTGRADRILSDPGTMVPYQYRGVTDGAHARRAPVARRRNWAAHPSPSYHELHGATNCASRALGAHAQENSLLDSQIAGKPDVRRQLATSVYPADRTWKM